MLTKVGCYCCGFSKYRLRVSVFRSVMALSAAVLNAVQEDVFFAGLDQLLESPLPWKLTQPFSTQKTKPVRCQMSKSPGKQGLSFVLCGGEGLLGVLFSQAFSFERMQEL